ncbi:MAG: hypothetical protein M0Z69_01360 [Actinomycetota bacterium]|nr:hypothetical protein [Actinomycetota bacterium]
MRAHALLCFLATYVTFHLRDALAPLTFAGTEPPTRTGPVAPAPRSLQPVRACLGRGKLGLAVRAFGRQRVKKEELEAKLLVDPLRMGRLPGGLGRPAGRCATYESSSAAAASSSRPAPAPRRYA